MDKEWLHLSRFSEQYRDGAQNFVERARENCNSEMIVCPCVKCRNLMHQHYDTVYEHLVIKGMDPTYTVWVFHGEQPSESNLLDVEMLESHRMFKDFYAQHDVDPENPPNGMRQKNPDIKGLRTRVWAHGHLRKDGQPVNEAAAETLKRIEICSQSISNTPAEDSIRDDAVARILGPERSGRVRGLGFGVTLSKVDAQIHSNARVRKLESQLQTQSERMGALEEKVEALLKLCQQSKQGSGVQGGIVHMENARCQLLHWYMFEEEEVVAEGRIATTDPSAKVHHLPLGKDCWKVWVEEVYMGHLTLYRPTVEFRTLREAMGSTIAWPKSSIRLL